jgi:hypothetical protein
MAASGLTDSSYDPPGKIPPPSDSGCAEPLRPFGVDGVVADGIAMEAWPMWLTDGGTNHVAGELRPTPCPEVGAGGGSGRRSREIERWKETVGLVVQVSSVGLVPVDYSKGVCVRVCVCARRRWGDAEIESGFRMVLKQTLSKGDVGMRR